MFHFGTPFVDGGGSTKVTRFDLGGLYRCPESDSAHLLFAAKGVTFRYPPGRRGKFDLRHRCISVLHSGRALAAENSAVSFSHTRQKNNKKKAAEFSEAYTV